MRRLLAVTALAVVVAGCAAEQPDDIIELAEGKWGTGEVLTDVVLTAERVPAVASADAVHYLGGTATDPNAEGRAAVPGPTDYWVEAVVDFGASEDIPAALACDEGTADDGPDVLGQLAPFVAEGDWVLCDLPAAASPGWFGAALVNVQAGQVVLFLTSA